MRRARAVLTMMLAIGVAAHALSTRPEHPADAASPGAAVAVPFERQLASFERDADEDELMAVDADRPVISVQADAH